VKRAYLLMAVVIIGWSVGPVGAKALLHAAGAQPSPHPLQVSFWAISAGWVLMLALLAVRGRLARLGDFTARGWLVLIAMGFFGWAGYASSLNYALRSLPLPDAVIINYLHPVFTVLFQGAIFGRLARGLSGWEQAQPMGMSRPPWARLGMGMALSLAGVAFIASGGRLTALLGGTGLPGLGPQPVAGALAALFAAISWGIYSNLGRFVSVKPGRQPSGAADVQTFAAMTLGLAMLAAALAAMGMLRSPAGYQTPLYFLHWGPATVSAWAVAAGMGLLLYGLGFTLWLAALELGRAAGQAHRLPPLTYLTPVLAVTNGWIVLHEGFGRGFWWGGLLIAAGNLLIALPTSGAGSQPADSAPTSG